MIFIVAGEGPTDIGAFRDDTFKAGPMALFIDKLIEPILN